MNKELAKYKSEYQGIDIHYENKPKDPEYKKDDSELQVILDEIFSVDPVTGFPRGDIAYYLSKDGNPQVKQWLEINLLKPRTTGNQTPKDVTDDMIIEMSRQRGESIEDYQTRLMSIYDAAKADFEKLSALPVEPTVVTPSE